MSVVNCRVKHIRPQYENLKIWMEQPENVYIGRPGIVFIEGARYPKNGSVFANPFKGEGALEKFKTYIRNRLIKEPELVQQLIALRGKNLGCWCHPSPCHGDVLLELIEEYYSGTQRF